ncbi:MAG: peptidoglycan-binding domain-containing protein [Gallintestinimicrobium sp.]
MAGKAEVHSGTVGTFTFLVPVHPGGEGILHRSYGRQLRSEVSQQRSKAFQKANGLDADGWCGAETWYALFN